MTRPRVLTAAVVVATGALIATGLWFGLSNRTDPRFAWANAADALCAEVNAAITANGIPTDIADPEVHSEFSAVLAATQHELAVALEKIDTPTEDTEALADTVISTVVHRGELWEAVAEEGVEFPDPSTGWDDYEPGPAVEILETYTAVADVMAPWGAPACGQNQFDPAQISGPTPMEVWAATIEEHCLNAHDQFRQVDRNADPTNPQQYLTALAEEISELADELNAQGPPPHEDAVDIYEQLLDAVTAAGDAGRAGNLDQVRAANTEWMTAAEPLTLHACAAGIVSSEDESTNLVATPPLYPISSAGFDPAVIDGDGIVDAELVLSYATSQLFTAARPDPATTYGLHDLVGYAIDETVSATSGDIAATPTSVSISEPRLTDTDAPATADNPWIVGIAIVDTSGTCMWAQMLGLDTLYSYTEPAPATGACTGDAAAATPLP